MTEKNRIAAVDGLRALAIMLVLARHSMLLNRTDATLLPLGGWDISTPLLNGWIGVDLFFVLSGFLITTQLLKGFFAEDKKAAALGVYFWRRFWRIAPAYYIVLTLVCLQLLPMPLKYPETVWGWRYLYHLLFLQDYWPPDINIVFWSLAIEAKFYILAPLLLAAAMALRGCGKYIVLAVLFAAMPLLRHWAIGGHEALYDTYAPFFFDIRNQFHLCMDGLLAGAMCAVAWRDNGVRARLEAHADVLFAVGTAIILLLLFATPMMENGVSFIEKRLLFTVIAGSFALMLLGLMAGARAGRCFSHPALGFIARISYSLYLLHLPAFYISVVLAQKIFGALPPALSWASVLPFYILLSVGSAWALYILVEKPAIEFSRRPGFSRK